MYIHTLQVYAIAQIGGGMNNIYVTYVMWTVFEHLYILGHVCTMYVRGGIYHPRFSRGWG